MRRRLPLQHIALEQMPIGTATLYESKAVQLQTDIFVSEVVCVVDAFLKSYALRIRFSGCVRCGYVSEVICFAGTFLRLCIADTFLRSCAKLGKLFHKASNDYMR